MIDLGGQWVNGQVGKVSLYDMIKSIRLISGRVAIGMTHIALGHGSRFRSLLIGLYMLL